jgi:ESX-1 secreted protein B PE domain
MTQTLNVEYDELMRRADEIERPLPAIPSTNPPGPCALSFVNDAATQLALSADSMRLYLRACEREWRTLAKSLRNAAKAYEKVDEEAGDAIDNVDNGSSASAVTLMSGGENSSVSMLGGGCEDETPWVPPPPPPPPPPFQYPYYEVRQAATDIEAGDQGTAFKAFAREWEAFQVALQREVVRFRPFESWEGEARLAVEQNFEAHRQWIYTMASLCLTLGSQALRVVEAHKKARVDGQHVSYNPDGTYAVEAEHPTTYEVSQCDYWYKYYTQNNSYYLYMAISWYESLQAKSEASLNQYVRNASLPLAPVFPKAPPTGTRIDPPPDPKPDPDPSPGPDIPDDGIPNPDNPIDNLPTDDSLPDPTGMTMPATPSAGMPATPPVPTGDAKLTEALKDLKRGAGGLPGGAGVKPASLGGGAGMPSMALQPSADGEAGSRPAGAAPGTAGLGRGVPGLGGAMGGGGPMGGMPMGGQGDKNAGKGKAQGEEESLYTEDREWTEGVIGNRPRKAAPDNKA